MIASDILKEKKKKEPPHLNKLEEMFVEYWQIQT